MLLLNITEDVVVITCNKSELVEHLHKSTNLDTFNSSHFSYGRACTLITQVVGLQNKTPVVWAVLKYIPYFLSSVYKLVSAYITRHRCAEMVIPPQKINCFFLTQVPLISANQKRNK